VFFPVIAALWPAPSPPTKISYTNKSNCTCTTSVRESVSPTPSDPQLL
jgi:hypothetical protein